MALAKILVACLLAVVVEGGYYPNPRLSQVPYPPAVPPYPYPPNFPYPPPSQLKELDILYPPPRYQEVDLLFPQYSQPIIEETFELRPRYPYPAPGGFWPSPPRGSSRPLIVEEFITDPIDDARNFNSFQISTTSDGKGGALTLVSTNDNGNKQTYVSPANARGQFYRIPPQLSSAVTNRFLRQAASLAGSVGDYSDYKIPTFSSYPMNLPLIRRMQTSNRQTSINFRPSIRAKPVATADIVTIKRIN